MGENGTTAPEAPEAPEAPGPSRRAFLGKVAGIAAATTVGLPGVLARGTTSAEASACGERGPLKGQARRDAAFTVRVDAASSTRNQPLAVHDCNADEDRYLTRIASYSKALPHNKLGEVDPVAYAALVTAIESGKHDAFELVPMGGVRRLTNPQAANAYGIEGADSHDFAVQAPPAFDSAQRAAEMAELYWQALTRDVPFSEYDTNPLVAEAATDLTRMSDLRAPKDGVRVTPRTIFRGHTPGDLAGPYVSQFLWKDVPYGPSTIVQRYASTPAGVDYLTSFPAWLSAQRGEEYAPAARETTLRYIRSNRDLAEWVHRDLPFQAGVNAALILMATPGTADLGNPYLASKSQDGFCTFGGPWVLDMVGRVANAALRAAWFQKWSLHRTLRPEAFGGRVHNTLTGAAAYPIHSDLLVVSSAPSRVRERERTYLLPVSYPEGSPCHPSYPSGHSCFAGATITMLKALFDENAVLPNPVVATSDGLGLVPYTGPALTVGGELNKLAANACFGRNAAGVHYRSDVVRGLLLGEAVAMRLLAELKATYGEPYTGFAFTKFDGTTVFV